MPCLQIPVAMLDGDFLFSGRKTTPRSPRHEDEALRTRRRRVKLGIFCFLQTIFQSSPLIPPLAKGRLGCGAKFTDIYQLFAISYKPHGLLDYLSIFY